jgi:hypothetical protein
VAADPTPRCEAVAGDLVDVALRVREPVEVPGLEEHLESCAACRAELDELTRTADQVAVAGPEAQPPPGFASAAVAAMAPADGAVVDVVAGPVHRGRRVLLAVAACVVLVVGGLVAWRTTTGSHTAPPSASAPSGATRTARLVAASGADVGGLTLRPGDRSSLTVWLDGAPAGVTYRCVVVLADGTRRTVGAWTTSGPGADWTVGLDGVTGVRRVEIRSTDDTTLASATL